MKIGIWGSLDYGNFGDYVMNVMFALYLKKLGCTPVVYRLDEQVAKTYRIQTAQTLDELLLDARFTFIGGGSWLESRELGNKYERDFKAYLQKIEQYRTPVYALSIGGDSGTAWDQLSTCRKQLFSSRFFKGGTVRLKKDAKIFRDLGKKVAYYPDMVLHSADYFLKTPSGRPADTCRVGITTHQVSLIQKYERVIKYTPFLYSNIELVFLKTHLPEYNINNEYQTPAESPRIRNFRYENLETYYAYISGLDAVISSKLHPGVAALSCGVPYLWVPGLDKTRSFLQSACLQAYENNLHSFLRKILRRQMHTLTQHYDMSQVNEQRKKSKGHMAFLKKIVAEAQN